MDSDSGEEEVGLPHASVMRVARAAAPDANFAREAQQILPACCEQFVRLLTAEVVGVVDRAERAVVAANDVEAACKALGFDFGAELRQTRGELESKKKAAKIRKSAQTVIPPEERARLQELMFAEAAKDMGM